MPTTTTITPEEIQALNLYLHLTPAYRYTSLVATILLSWELVLTFPYEVRLWNSKWTIGKILFLLNRYLSLGYSILTTILTSDTTPTDAVCTADASFGIIASLLVANIEIILQHRLFALYGYDRRIVIPVVALFIVVFGIMMVMAAIIFIYGKDHETQISGSCAILGSVNWVYLLWVPVMVLDFVLVMLASYRSLQHYFQVPDKTWSGALLMRTFARDSIIYFLCNFLVYLFNTLLGKFGPPQYYQLGAITISIIPPISANRLIINMYDSTQPKPDLLDSFWDEDSPTTRERSVESSAYNEGLELAFMNMKGLRYTSLDDVAC